jgi:hypothetical protein
MAGKTKAARDQNVKREVRDMSAVVGDVVASG